ncbi:MAG: hypothetical protein M3464_01005 [Chloroflexota bacterium]|nr:hypothetical protein [Chloroflexota bacterium]
MAAKKDKEVQLAVELPRRPLTPKQSYKAACEALRTEAFPGFERFSDTMKSRGRAVAWRPEFDDEAMPSVRIAVADRDGQIMDTSLVVDLRRGDPRLFWAVTPRGQVRHAYTDEVPGGIGGIAADTVVRSLTSLYTSALTD